MEHSLDYYTKNILKVPKHCGKYKKLKRRSIPIPFRFKGQYQNLEKNKALHGNFTGAGKVLCFLYLNYFRTSRLLNHKHRHNNVQKHKDPLP